MTILADAPQEWVKCPGCGDEFSKLGEGGICLPCSERKNDVKVLARMVDERMVSMMGEKGARLFTFDGYRQSDGTANGFAAMRAFNVTTSNALLWGPTGTGKTHLCGSLLRKTMESRGPASSEFHKVPRLLRWFHLRKPSDQDAELDRLAKLDLLILDDVGVEKSSDYNLGILYELLDARDMSDRNGLVVTSNLRPSDLAEKFGDDRLPSRLFGMCKENIFELRAPDARIGGIGK